MVDVTESPDAFAQRKRDHIQLALEMRNEAIGLSGLERIRLQHEALPEIDFAEVSLSHTILGRAASVPFILSSMTAGHDQALTLNRHFAEASAHRGWLMGVGSQRRELFDPTASEEWRALKRQVPKVRLLGNLGLSQAIQVSTSAVKRLIEELEAEAMIIHANPLQEALQVEGTPQFRGGFATLTRLARELPVPVILKETGCGFSTGTLARLKDTGVAAVDVSGLGGTHWGRIEGHRSEPHNVRALASASFADWGMSTVDSLLAAQEVGPNYEVWASGGIRSGVDAAKVLAMGAHAVGLAKPLLIAALKGAEVLEKKMEAIEYELKTALFCTGCRTIADLRERKPWQWHRTPSE